MKNMSCLNHPLESDSNSKTKVLALLPNVYQTQLT